MTSLKQKTDQALADVAGAASDEYVLQFQNSALAISKFYACNFKILRL
jgi:hypothetical protein